MKRKKLWRLEMLITIEMRRVGHSIKKDKTKGN